MIATNLVSDEIAEHVINASVNERAEFCNAYISFENIGPTY